MHENKWRFDRLKFRHQMEIRMGRFNNTQIAWKMMLELRGLAEVYGRFRARKYFVSCCGRGAIAYG